MIGLVIKAVLYIPLREITPDILRIPELALGLWFSKRKSVGRGARP